MFGLLVCKLEPNKPLRRSKLSPRRLCHPHPCLCTCKQKTHTLGVGGGDGGGSGTPCVFWLLLLLLLLLVLLLPLLSLLPEMGRKLLLQGVHLALEQVPFSCS